LLNTLQNGHSAACANPGLLTPSDAFDEIIQLLVKRTGGRIILQPQCITHWLIAKFSMQDDRIEVEVRNFSAAL
jgi:hypothetical protein